MQIDANYIVFFPPHSDAVGPRDHQVIRDFLASLSRESTLYGDMRVVLRGSKDTSEVTRRDRTLELRRARAVERLLRDGGLPPETDIDFIAQGANLSVPTPPLTPERFNRHVWLTYGGRQLRPTQRQADCIDWLSTHRCDPPPNAAEAGVCERVEKVAHEFQP